MHMEVRALFGRFVWRGVNIDVVTIHPSRGSRINPTLKVSEHNRVAHALVVAFLCVTCWNAAECNRAFSPRVHRRTCLSVWCALL